MAHGRRGGGGSDTAINLRVRGRRDTTRRQEGRVRRNDHGPGQRVTSDDRRTKGTRYRLRGIQH